MIRNWAESSSGAVGVITLRRQTAIGPNLAAGSYRVRIVSARRGNCAGTEVAPAASGFQTTTESGVARSLAMNRSSSVGRTTKSQVNDSAGSAGNRPVGPLIATPFSALATRVEGDSSVLKYASVAW